MMRAAMIVLAACGGGGAATIAPAPPAPAAGPTLTISNDAFGPLTVKTRANLVALRAALPELEIRAAHGPHEIESEFEDEPDLKLKPTLEYQAFDPASGEKLFAVVPDGTGGISSVEIVSAKIAVAGRPWRVHAKLADASALTTCLCRKAQPLCFKQGERIALAFARGCRGTSVVDARRRHRLEGVAIARIVWAPAPSGFGGVTGDGPDEPILDDDGGP